MRCCALALISRAWRAATRSRGLRPSTQMETMLDSSPPGSSTRTRSSALNTLRKRLANARARSRIGANPIAVAYRAAAPVPSTSAHANSQFSNRLAFRNRLVTILRDPLRASHIDEQRLESSFEERDPTHRGIQIPSVRAETSLTSPTGSRIRSH